MAIDPISAKSAVMKSSPSTSFEGMEPEVPFKDVFAQVQQPSYGAEVSSMPKSLPQLPLEVLNRHMTPQQLASFVAEMVPMPEEKRRQRLKTSGIQNLEGKQNYIAQGSDPLIPQNLIQPQEGGLSPVQQIMPAAQGNPYLAPRAVQNTPFQFFIEKSLDYFRKVSGMEMKTDQLMVDYIEGRATIEELTIEKAKVSVAISFGVTILQQVTNAFNEIKNMSI